MSAPYIRCLIENRIAHVEFHNPKANSFESNQLSELSNLLDELSLNPEVNVVSIRSSGEQVFCAGAAFHELITIQNLDQATEFFMGFGRLMHSIVQCQKVVLAVVQGSVVGGGVGLVSACDYAIAADRAKIKLSELSIGIGPFVIEPAIRRKVGLNKFSSLCLNPARWKSAEWAYESGFYQELHHSSVLDQKVNEYLDSYKYYHPEAISKIKSVLRQGTEHWPNELPKRAQMSGELLLNPSTQELLKNLIK